MKMEIVLTDGEIERYEALWLQALKQMEDKKRMLTDTFMGDFVDVQSRVPADYEEDPRDVERDWEYFPTLPVGVEWDW